MRHEVANSGRTKGKTGRLCGIIGGKMQLITRTKDGLYRLPAFIGAHVHVESSHLTPARFGRLIAAQGTLTAVCDPHEIVNAMGEAGLDFMLADAKRSPANLRFALLLRVALATCVQNNTVAHPHKKEPPPVSQGRSLTSFRLAFRNDQYGHQ